MTGLMFVFYVLLLIHGHFPVILWDVFTVYIYIIYTSNLLFKFSTFLHFFKPLYDD